LWCLSWYFHWMALTVNDARGVNIGLRLGVAVVVVLKAVAWWSFPQTAAMGLFAP
jgi:hypothetical protein